MVHAWMHASMHHLPSRAATAVESGALAPVRMRVLSYLSACHVAFLNDICCCGQPPVPLPLRRHLCTALSPSECGGAGSTVRRALQFLRLLRGLLPIFALFDDLARMLCFLMGRYAIGSACDTCCADVMLLLSYYKVSIKCCKSFCATKNTDWKTMPE